MANAHNISILLAEDNRDLLFLVQEHLKAEGFTVYSIDNGLDAYRLFLERKPAIAVLDIDMPEIDGIKLCTQIRKLDDRTPIIFTTGYSETHNVKIGFEAGANDYLKKPYDVDELTIRIRHLTKTLRPDDDVSDRLFYIGTFVLNSDLHVLTSDKGIEYSLSYTENTILEILCQNLGHIVPRERFINAVWGSRPAFDSRSIDVYVSRLRKYLAQGANANIINCYGRGYRLVIFKNGD